MASAAQIEANRLNAAASSGPTSPEGKARSSRNRLKFGLFSTQNCVRPEETAEYTKLSKALWKDLNPVGPVEEMLAVEIVRAAWRLHRCTLAEAEDGATPATQAAVDRARAAAHASLRRFLNDLRQFQSDRWLRAEVLRDGFDEQHIGIADAHRVIKGLADNERLKSLFLTSPIGIDPINQPVGQASRPVEPPTAPTIRTHSAEKVGQAISSPANKTLAGHALSVAPAVSAAGAGQSPSPQSQVPRNAPCPCHSGFKYKRCCGTVALPVLTTPLGLVGCGCH
jgi:SEC-C motif